MLLDLAIDVVAQVTRMLIDILLLLETAVNKKTNDKGAHLLSMPEETLSGSCTIEIGNLLISQTGSSC